MASRNVQGYIKAYRREIALVDKLKAKETKLEPLRIKVRDAGVKTHNKYNKLTGGQIAEAERIIKG